MATLSDVIAEQEAMKQPAKVIKMGRTADDLAPKLEASSKIFYKVRIPVEKIPMMASGNGRSTGDIIVDINAGRTKLKNGFIPKVVVFGGLNTLKKIKGEDRSFCNVWMGSKAIKKLRIMADDAVGSSELGAMLGKLLISKYGKKGNKGDGPSAYENTPWIREVYPFENYVIFDLGGETFRQAYTLDPVKRLCALVGDMVRVYPSYLSAPKGLEKPPVSAASLASTIYSDQDYIDVTMNQERMFDPINHSSPALGALRGPGGEADTTAFPSNSEIGNPSFRAMLNVEEALNLYLGALKNGTHAPFNGTIRQIQIPISASAMREAEVAARAAKVQINIQDFLMWQNKMLTMPGTKMKNGLAAGSYAYVGDKNDISTWDLECDSLENIEASLERLHLRDTSVPKYMRPQVKIALLAMKKKKKKVKADEQLMVTPSMGAKKFVPVTDQDVRPSNQSMND